MPVILATQEAENQEDHGSKPAEKIVHKTLSRKTLHKNRAGGEAQV
jgi:hypothetical protein